MLYSIILKLKAQTEALVSPTQGYHSYALFLDIIRRANSQLAQRLHDSPSAKPFTLSPLHGKFVRVGQQVRIEPGAIYWLRLTILEDEIFAALLDAVLQRKRDAPLSLDNASFEVEEIVTTPGKVSGVECDTFEAIYDRNRDRDRVIIVRFSSPTTFRSGGKRNILFPQPALVFGSLLARWNALSSLKLPEAVKDAVVEGVTLSQYNLRTHILHFPDYQEVGFEGTAHFLIDKHLDDEALQAINALAVFAFYSGVGAKTTMGMGQCQRQEMGSGR